MQKEDVRLWAAAKRCFGSYQAALDAAGVSVPKPADEWSWPASRLRAAALPQKPVILTSLWQPVELTAVISCRFINRPQFVHYAWKVPVRWQYHERQGV